MLFAVLLAVALVMVTVYAREGASGPLHSVQSAVSGMVAPLRFFGAGVGAATEGAQDAVTNVLADDATLTQLREQNAQLINLVSQTEEYRQEAERLQSLLDLKESSGAEGVSARVIGRSTDAWNQTVTIDAGSSSGVTAGLTVMGSSGVIGQVVSVSSSSSTVRLLSDPQSGAAAIVQSSRAEGVVRGSLDGLLYLENVDANVTVSTGDIVVTSGLGGSYTKGLLIGTVVKVEGSAGDASRSILVAQNEAASSLEEVVVVQSVLASSSDEDAAAQDGEAQSDEGGDD